MLGSIGGQHEDAGGGKTFHEVGEELSPGVPEQLQIVHFDDQGLSPAPLDGDVTEGIEHSELQLLATQPGEMPRASPDTEENQQVRGPPIGIHPEVLEAGTHLPGYHLPAVLMRDLPRLPQHLDHGQVGQPAAIRHESRPVMGELFLLESLAELVQETGLAGPRLGDDADRLPIAGRRPPEKTLEKLQPEPTADEWG